MSTTSPARLSYDVFVSDGPGGVGDERMPDRAPLVWSPLSSTLIFGARDAGEKADAFVTAAATLAGQGDLALALEILAPGLLRHPDSSELAELRQAVLIRLIEQRQLSDPLGFLVYAELAAAELSPLR